VVILDPGYAIDSFFTVARYGERPPYIVLPPGEHNGKNHIALAEVCGLRVPRSFVDSLVVMCVSQTVCRSVKFWMTSED